MIDMELDWGIIADIVIGIFLYHVIVGVLLGIAKFLDRLPGS